MLSSPWDRLKKTRLTLFAPHRLGRHSQDLPLERTPPPIDRLVRLLSTLIYPPLYKSTHLPSLQPLKPHIPCPNITLMSIPR